MYKYILHTHIYIYIAIAGEFSDFPLRTAQRFLRKSLGRVYTFIIVHDILSPSCATRARAHTRTSTYIYLYNVREGCGILYAPWDDRCRRIILDTSTTPLLPPPCIRCVRVFCGIIWK